MKKPLQWMLSALTMTTVALTGCAKNPTSPDDPFEPYNRAMFAVNTDIDHLVFIPAATVYDAVTPPFVQQGVTNFFDNTDELTTLPNDFLQGNFRYMALDTWRFIINSTLGIGGLFDVATKLGMPKHVETFGLTLAKWRGGQSAPYFVIPILGPATIQTGIGLIGSYYMSPWPYLRDQDINYIANGIRFVNYRAELLPADKLVDNAFDPYTFVRDAYLQKEAYRIARNQALYSGKADDIPTSVTIKNGDVVSSPGNTLEPAGPGLTVTPPPQPSPTPTMTSGAR